MTMFSSLADRTYICVILAFRSGHGSDRGSKHPVGDKRCAVDDITLKDLGDAVACTGMKGQDVCRDDRFGGQWPVSASGGRLSLSHNLCKCATETKGCRTPACTSYTSHVETNGNCRD